MKSWLCAAFVGALLSVAGPGAIGHAVAAPSAKKSAGAATATDFSAHRHHRRYHRHTVHSRPSAPVYYARPVYYRPYPYQTPAPFFLGIGFGPRWW